MAKCSSQKARKDYVCSKCGRLIQKGEFYYKIEEMYRPVKHRCSCCKPERSELTSSEYYQWLYNLQDHLSDNFDLRDECVIDELTSEIESQKDELDYRLENIPEQLRDADAGTTLQERIDALDNAISDLECLEYPVYEDIIENVDVDDAEDEDAAEEMKNQAWQDALDEFESSVEEIISNID